MTDKQSLLELAKSLERAALRLDMLAAIIVENQPAFAATKWANEAREHALRARAEAIEGDV